MRSLIELRDEIKRIYYRFEFAILPVLKFMLAFWMLSLVSGKLGYMYQLDNLGLILIAAEIFVLPGFGICGISGIIAVVVSLAFAMIDNIELFHWVGTLNLQPLLQPPSSLLCRSCLCSFRKRRTCHTDTPL